MSTKSLIAFLLVAAPAWSQPQVLIAGLQAPNKIVLTPGGNLIVSETSMTANNGRLSIVTRSGVRRSLLEGLPSGTEVTLTGASGPNAMALRERTLYLAFGAGDAERAGGSQGTSQPNPTGPSSPIFASILEIRFNQDIDSIAGPFRLTPAHQVMLTDGGQVELDDTGGGRAQISILARFPNTEPDPRAVYRFSSPWGLALSDDGRTLYATDASLNALVRVDTSTGRWRRIARFPPFANPGTVGPPVVDAVPTSLRVYGDRILVSFLTGFPFVPGNARIFSVNPETGASELFISGLTSATDILWRPRPNARPQFFVTEFSLNQSATPAPPGRLLRYDTPVGQAAGVLITPVSLAFDESTQDLYILELRGQILRLHID